MHVILCVVCLWIASCSGLYHWNQPIIGDSFASRSILSATNQLTQNNTFAYSYVTYKNHYWSFEPFISDSQGNVFGTFVVTYTGFTGMRSYNTHGAMNWQTNFSITDTSSSRPSMVLIPESTTETVVVSTPNGTYGFRAKDGSITFTNNAQSNLELLAANTTWFSQTQKNEVCRWTASGRLLWCISVLAGVSQSGASMLFNDDNLLVVPCEGVIVVYEVSMVTATQKYNISVPITNHYLDKITVHITPVALFILQQNLTAYDLQSGEELWFLNNTVGGIGAWAHSVEDNIAFLNLKVPSTGYFVTSKIDLLTGKVLNNMFPPARTFEACVQFSLDVRNAILWAGCGGYLPAYPTSTYYFHAVNYETGATVFQTSQKVQISPAAEFYPLLLITPSGQIIGDGEASDFGSFRLTTEKPGPISGLRLGEQTYNGVTVNWDVPLQDVVWSTEYLLQYKINGQWMNRTRRLTAHETCTAVKIEPANRGQQIPVRLLQFSTLSGEFLSISNTVDVVTAGHPPGACPTPLFFDAHGGLTPNASTYEVAVPHVPNNTFSYPGAASSVEFSVSGMNCIPYTKLNGFYFSAHAQFHIHEKNDYFYHFSMKAMLQIDTDNDGTYDVTEYYPSKDGPGDKLYSRESGYGPEGDKYYVFHDDAITAVFNSTKIMKTFTGLKFSVWMDRHFYDPAEHPAPLYVIDTAQDAAECRRVGCAHNEPGRSQLNIPGWDPNEQPQCPRY